MTNEPADLTGTRTDVLVPTRDLARIPMISSEQYQHAGRFAGAMVMSCFEQIGGLSRFAAWADGNPTDFYTKLFPKMITRAQQVDVSGTLTIDDAISRLESAGPIIEADYSDFNEMPEQLYDL